MIKYYIKFPILTKAIKYIIQLNNSTNTYHNIDHLFNVFKYCTILSEQEIIKNELELYIAALFHDYNHIGKMSNDKKAKEAVTTFHSLYPQFNLEYVHYLIDATEYPYTVNENLLTIEAKIIRDADMSYIIEDISIVKLYYGLRNEFEQPLNEFLENQVKFYTNIKFYTQYMQNIWYKIKEDKLKEIEFLK